MLDYIIQNSTDTELAALCGLASIVIGLPLALIIYKLLP